MLEIPEATDKVSAPELTSAPLPEMPPVPLAVMLRLLEALLLVMLALSTMPVVAFKIRLCVLDQITGLWTVNDPVEVTVVLAVARSFCSRVTLTLVDELAPVEMVRLDPLKKSGVNASNCG